MKLHDGKIFSQIDPYFQCLLARRHRGLTNRHTASTGAGELAVIARVKDVGEWEQISEVRAGTVIGDGGDGTSIVTARIPLQRVEAVRGTDGVVSLKPARKLRPLLDATVADTRARIDLLPGSTEGEQGSGVVVGIVDFGADVMHQNFRFSDGTTRIEAIWDQNTAPSADSPEGFGYGTLYTQSDINIALQTADPYQALGYEPPPDNPFLPPGTHGTHVMDIAAGNGEGSGLPGVAPEATFIFVEPAATDIPWSGPNVVGANFGDSVQLLEAIKFVFDQAGERPCVVNLSLGTNGGPHDGTSLVEQGIDALVSQQPNRAVVIAASNSFADGIHVEDNVAQGSSTDVFWEVVAGDTTDNEIEIWYSSQDSYNVELIAPNGQSLGSIALGANGTLQSDAGETLMFVSHRQQDPNNGDNTIGVFMESSLPPGRWILRLHGEQVNDGHFHGWIERDDRGQSSFAPPHNNTHTLGSISTGHHSIVVGSFDAHKPSRPLSWFSSAGPTRDGRQKPEVSAPGHDVFAAHSRTLSGGVRKSGTSMAAPAVTGVIALMMSEALARGMDLDIATIRMLISELNQNNPPTGEGWDPRYGSGRVDASALIQAIIDRDQG
ncbi:MAG: S8 family peptidase [Pseudomonadota bacterium]